MSLKKLKLKLKVTKAPLAFSVLTASSYLFFYSGFDKGSRSLRPVSKLRSIFTFKSIHYSLNEINKVLALTGLTILSATFLLESSSKWLQLNRMPLFKAIASGAQIQELRNHALCILSAHGLYSLYAYVDRYKLGHPKLLAMVSGSCALSTLCLCQTNYLSSKYLGIVGLGFGVLHFYAMEQVPNGYGMNVRPYAYLAIAVALLAFANEVAVRVRAGTGINI